YYLALPLHLHLLVSHSVAVRDRVLSLFFFSSRRRHTRSKRDWSSDVCSSDLLEENKSLKSKISDLKRDVSLIYESTKEFLKERTDGLKAFKNVFKGFVDKVKDKTAQFQEKHDLEPKKNEFELT